MSQWEIGDLVRLKSGGPRMTVTASNPKQVTVGFFTDKGKFQQVCVHPLSLLAVVNPRDIGMKPKRASCKGY